MLAASLGPAIEAFRLFFTIGRPARNAAEGADLWFEKTTMLIAVGIHRFIGHPMQASLIGLEWGAFLKHPSGIGLDLALGACGFLVGASIAEERENFARFGPAYAAYMGTTRRFLPLLF